MYNKNLYEQRIMDYAKNIQINTFFNEEGLDLKEVMKGIILKECNPLENKK